MLKVKQISVRSACSMLICTAWFAEAASIELWHSHQAHNFIELRAKQFEKLTGHPVRVVAYDSEKFKAELLLSAATGNLPDMIFVPSDYLGLYEELKLMPIDEEIAQLDIEEKALDTVTIDGKFWGVPIIQGNHLLLYYNKELVKNPANSWDELVNQKKYKFPEYNSVVGMNYNAMYWFVSFLGAYGGAPLDGGVITLDTPAMRKALQMYKRLATEKILNSACLYECAFDDFVAHQYPYAINGDWAYSALKTKMGDKLGLATLPELSIGPLRSMSATHALAYPNVRINPEHHQKRHQFHRFLLSEKTQLDNYERFHLLPVNSSVMKQVTQNSKGDSNTILKQFEGSVAMPSSVQMAIAWQAIAQGFIRFSEQNYSAQEAATYMQNLADRELNKIMRHKEL